MSEYRTHLRESVEALRDAAQRVAEALDETAGLGDAATPNSEASDAAVGPSSAPSSQPDARRWWLNVYHWGDGLEAEVHAHMTEADAREAYSATEEVVDHDPGETIPVVPAAALDAMREERDLLRERLDAAEGIAAQYAVERDEAIHEQHVANDHLASLRRVIARRGPEMQALDEAIRDRGCYDPAQTVAQNALAYIHQLGEWLDQRTNSANALLVERDTAIRERNEEIVKLSLCQIGRKHAQEERAAAIRERDEARGMFERAEHNRALLSVQLRAARRLTPEVFEQACKAFRCAGITRQSVADSLRAALLAAGFQEDEA